MNQRTVTEEKILVTGMPQQTLGKGSLTRKNGREIRLLNIALKQQQPESKTRQIMPDQEYDPHYNRMY